MLLFLIAALVAVHVISMGTMPIDNYVWSNDENYGWTDMGENYILKGKGFTVMFNIFAARKKIESVVVCYYYFNFHFYFYYDNIFASLSNRQLLLLFFNFNFIMTTGLYAEYDFTKMVDR